MDASQKWTCPDCTYSNWPKSRKCTICSLIRDLPHPDDDLRHCDVSVSNEPSPPQKECLGFWSCSRCTFLNNPISKKCAQCDTIQTLVSESINTVNNTENLPLQVINKWKCARCTYENWPKSKNCVMCKSIEPCTPPLPVDEKRAKACDSVEAPVCQSSPKMDEQFSDDVWLNACKAIVLSEAAAIEAYLRSGEPLNRKLTVEESNILENWFSRQIKITSESLYSTSHTLQTKRDIRETLDCPYKPCLTLYDIAMENRRSDLSCLVHNSTISPSVPESVVENKVDLQRIDLNSTFLSRATTELSQINHQLPCPSAPGLDLLRRFFSKRSPCQASPYMAKELRRILLASIRQRKGDFLCNYISIDMGTFALPAAVRDLSPLVRNLLFAELLDTDAQTELEQRSTAINWWVTSDQQPTSRLFALWNRTDGDCLLDSLLQASWGVFDRQRTLRHALSESMLSCESTFFRIWREHEAFQAAGQYRLDDSQLIRDWENSIQAAIQPNASLEQIHIFVLCHILRRPVIVYGVKYINNFRDEPIGISNFQGIYLPLLWERSFCSRNPLILGYTRGHFNALVPMVPNFASTVSPKLISDILHAEEVVSLEDSEITRPCPPVAKSLEKSVVDYTPQQYDHLSPEPVTAKAFDSPRKVECTDSFSSCSPCLGSISRSTFSSGQSGNLNSSIYLPLFDRHGHPLPIHFASPADNISFNALVADRLEVVQTKRGFFLACLRLQPQSNLVVNLINDWLSIYHNISGFDTPNLTAAAGGSSSGGYC